MAKTSPLHPVRDLIRGQGDLLVLSVLADGPLYGYAITKQVAARSGGAVKLSPGVLYPLLHELERQGLVQTSWETIRADRNEDEESPGRKRKWYRLAAKGKKRLEQRIAAHRSYQALIESFLPQAGSEGAGR